MVQAVEMGNLHGLSWNEGSCKCRDKERNRIGKDLGQCDGILPLLDCAILYNLQGKYMYATAPQVLMPKLPPLSGGCARTFAPSAPLHLDRPLPSLVLHRYFCLRCRAPQGSQRHSYLFRIDILEELRIVYLRFSHV